jgi:hypothetical protein
MGEWAKWRADHLDEGPVLAHHQAMDFDDLLGRPERWASVLGWATLAGIEFGLIGPFGSYASHLFTRVAYWTALFWVGSLLLWPSVVTGLRLGPRRGFPPLFSGVTVCLVACVPLAALGAVETYIFWPLRASRMHLFDWYALTLVVALPAMAALMWLELRGGIAIRARLAGASNDGAVSDDTTRQASQSALPDHMLATALCLQMEDHHVRVHMHRHSFLHFAVMRQVVKAMDAQRGSQVHRSWWVARDAVRGWYREERAVILVLVNDLRVPVARNRVASLREQGWLDGAEWQASGGVRAEAMSL